MSQWVLPTSAAPPVVEKIGVEAGTPEGTPENNNSARKILGSLSPGKLFDSVNAAGSSSSNSSATRFATLAAAAAAKGPQSPQTPTPVSRTGRPQQQTPTIDADIYFESIQSKRRPTEFV